MAHYARIYGRNGIRASQASADAVGLLFVTGHLLMGLLLAAMMHE